MTVYMNFMYGIIYYKLLNHLKILNNYFLSSLYQSKSKEKRLCKIHSPLVESISGDM